MQTKTVAPRAPEKVGRLKEGEETCTYRLGKQKIKGKDWSSSQRTRAATRAATFYRGALSGDSSVSQEARIPSKGDSGYHQPYVGGLVWEGAT